MDNINSRAILEGINHPTLILNVSKEIVAANQTFQVKSGMNEEEIKGLKCFKLVHGSECCKTPQNCPMKMILNGRRETVEKMMETVDGYSMISCTPIFDDKGKLHRIMHLTTELTGIDEEFQTQNHHEFLENPMVPVFTSNLNGDILFANKAMADMFGFKDVEDLKNNKITFLYKNLEDRKLLIEELLKKRVLKGYEVDAVDLNGKSLNLILGALLKNGKISGMFMDITSMKNSKLRLKESEKMYRTLYSSMSEAVSINRLIYSDNGLPTDYEIIDVNPAFEEICGVYRENCIGKTASELSKLVKPPYFEIYSNVSQTGISTKFETYFELLDKFFDISVFSLSKDMFVTVSEDITDRKKSDDKIKASLKEKEVLLQEIHHRVKNNMQIISSLLNLQTMYVDGNEVALDVLKESQNRVTSMSMIHEKLYQSHDFMHVEIGEYIEKLVTDLLYSYAIPKGQIEPVVDNDEIELNIETSIPCGLIISELVSNSLKYAFPEGRKGTITVSIRNSDDGYILIVSDDGVGLPPNLEFTRTDSLGLELVNNLVDQIDGTIELDKRDGTKFVIKFNELEYKKRI
jgi:two-component system, sensor histidine kinase PdtaS